MCALGCAVVSGPAVVPDFFTLPEAGWILRIGRNSAYKLAIEFEATGGRSGLPFVRLGKLKRVPRLALEKLHGGPITWPLAADDTQHAPRSTAKRSNATRPVESPSTCPQSAPEQAPAETVPNTADPATKRVARAKRPTTQSSTNANATRNANVLSQSTTPEPVGPFADQQLALGFGSATVP